MPYSAAKLKEVATKLLFFFRTFQIENKKEKMFAYADLAVGFI
jgi:hypothetical protein